MTVKRGTTLDGLGRYYKETIKESDAAPVDVVAELKANKVDVLICYLPVGSEEAAKFYAQIWWRSNDWTWCIHHLLRLNCWLIAHSWR